MKILFRLSFYTLCQVIVGILMVNASCGLKRPRTVITPEAAVRSDSISGSHRGPIFHIVKKGETLAAILNELGVTPVLASNLSRALLQAGHTKLFPGDSLVLTYDTGCSLAGLSLLNGLQYWYHATCSGSAATVERQAVPLVSSCEILNGTLETSLLASVQQYGLGPYLACRLSDIFAWDINFFIDPRENDSFQIVFSRNFAADRCIGYNDVLAARYQSVTGRNYYAIGFRTAGGTINYFDLNGRSVQKEFLKAPLRYSRISSGFTFRRRHPIRGTVMPHLGIDYAAPAGTPVYAAAEGLIRKTGYDRNFGNHVEISHGGAYVTCYGHLASISSGIRPGVKVSQGQMIGTVGASGCATGPHLDYRMKRHGSSVNPLTVTLPSKTSITASDQEDFNRIKESYRALMEIKRPKVQGQCIVYFDDTPTNNSAGPPQ